MNAFELLKSDHDKVRPLLEKLGQTTDRAIKTREELFSKLKEELEIHSYIEETILYPALKEEAQTRDLTIQALEKHRLIALFLKEIGDLPVDHEQWGAKFKILQEIVESHVKEEEGELFKAARAALSKERSDELGAELEAEKQRQQTEEGAVARSRAALARPAELRAEPRAAGRGEDWAAWRAQRKAEERGEDLPGLRVQQKTAARVETSSESYAGTSQRRRQRPLIHFSLSCPRLPFFCRREC